jgi:ribosome-associated protein
MSSRAGLKSTTTVDAKNVAQLLARVMTDRHCDDLTIMDVRDLSQVCDFVVVGSGTSDRQMKSVADELSIEGKGVGSPAFRTHIDTHCTWVVVDFVDIVVHLFEPSRRAYYDIEGLWSDAPRVEIPPNPHAA